MASIAAEPLRVPNTLASALNERKAILFAGAGLSRLTGAPSWNQLLESLVGVAEREDPVRDDELYAGARMLATSVNTEQKYALADWLQDALGPRLPDALREPLEPLEPGDIHRQLAGLNWAGYITTNFDTLLEDAHAQVHGQRPKVITWRDKSDLMRLDRFSAWVLKLHGCITQPETVVLGQHALDTLLDDEAATRQLGSHLEQLHTVFVGYGLGDPDVMLELRRLVAIFRGSARDHFAVLANGAFSTIWRDYLYKRYRVKALLYHPDDEDHEPGLDGWAQALSEASKVEGPASRRKVLFCVKALRGANGEPARAQLLVTDRVRLWGVDRTPPPGADPLDKAFMVPPVDDVGKGSDDLAAQFAEMAEIDRASVATRIEHRFESSKENPALRRETRYAYRFVPVVIEGHREWFARDEPTIGGRVCQWKTLAELEAHDPTIRLNDDVLRELVAAYGPQLERLPFAMTGATLAAQDPYAERAAHYGSLPWVRDQEPLRELLTTIDTTGVPGLLDLGCGTGASAAVASELGLEYVGYDRSPAMIAAATGTLAALGHGTAELVDFRAVAGREFDGWIALVKNVLHLLPDPAGFFEQCLPSFGSLSTLVVIETVSPSPEARFWIENLFRLMGAEHKRHVFGQDDLAVLVDSAGWQIVEMRSKEQTIDVDPWIRSFGLDKTVNESIHAAVESAPAGVVEDMRITARKAGVSMLRLQQMITATRDPAGSSRGM